LPEKERFLATENNHGEHGRSFPCSPWSFFVARFVAAFAQMNIIGMAFKTTGDVLMGTLKAVCTALFRR
jgi:hypothetical protein